MISRSPSPSPSDSSSSSTPSAPFTAVLNPPPTLPAGVAARTLSHLIATTLLENGFDAAEKEVWEELDGVVASCALCLSAACAVTSADESSLPARLVVAALLLKAHGLAEVARRRHATVLDLVSGCEELGVGGASELSEETERARSPAANPIKLKFDRKRNPPKPQPRLVSPSLSDDEDKHPSTSLLRAPFLPPLPSKHSYKITPVFPSPLQPPALPPSALSSQSQQTPSTTALAHLSILRMRISDSRLMEGSLRNLIRCTRAGGAQLMEMEDRHGEGEGEGEGAERGEDDVVDYEGSWYANGNVKAEKGRKVRRLTVGKEGVALEGEEEKGKGTVGTEGAGLGKRRRWRV